jgi:hypothetical protein
MRTVYKVLAYVIAAEVAIQAMAVVWAVAGLGRWIMGGGVADASLMESDVPPFPEVAGFMIHGINGTFVIPIIALGLLVLSFFTRQRRPIVVAAALFAGVVLQGQLGFLGHEVPLVGALHGLNALLVFALALYAARGVAITQLPSAPAERPAARAV